jgi:hypothetical protein
MASVKHAPGPPKSGVQPKPWCHNQAVKTSRFAIAVLVLYASLVVAQTCDDITKLDLPNLRIHAGQRTFAFHNGVAQHGLLEQVPMGGQMESRHEWRAEIEKDAIVRPASDAVIRFLLIHDSHQTGSGWRYYLIGLRCSEGRLEQVFLRDGMSLTVDRLDAAGVDVGLVENPGDSTRKQWLYTWDGHRYVLSSTQ